MCCQHAVLRRGHAHSHRFVLCEHTFSWSWLVNLVHLIESPCRTACSHLDLAVWGKNACRELQHNSVFLHRSFSQLHWTVCAWFVTYVYASCLSSLDYFFQLLLGNLRLSYVDHGCNVFTMLVVVVLFFIFFFQIIIMIFYLLFTLIVCTYVLLILFLVRSTPENFKNTG